MKKSRFNIESDMAKDSLSSIVNHSGNPLVVGGMCVQLHALPLRYLLRNTPDLDLITKENREYSDFAKEITEDCAPGLKAKGYAVQTKNGRLNNSMIVIRNQNKENEEKFLVHFTTPHQNIRETLAPYINHEYEFSKEISYDEDYPPAKVVSLEEALPLKIRRSIRLGQDRESIVGPVYSTIIEHAISSNWGYLAGQKISTWVNILDEMQKKIDEGPSSDKVETYKMSKDIYDLCLSAKAISDGIYNIDKDRYEYNLEKILDNINWQHLILS